ncbi:MAG: PorV/PorQ family protein [bacterium]
MQPMKGNSVRLTILWLTLLLTLPAGRRVLAQETTVSAASQESNGAPGVFLRLGVGARALGMGSAFTAVANDASAGYWNPAGLDLVERAQFEFMNVDLPFDRTFNFISTALPIKNLFTLGASWVGLRVNDIEGRTTNSVEPEYFFGNSQNAFFFSFGKTLGYNLAVGGSLKLIRNTLDEDAANGLGFDAGVMLRLTDRISLGALAQDIGTDYRWDSGLTEGVPMTLRLGAAVKAYDGVMLAADVSQVSGLEPTLHLGAEIRPLKVLPIRLGYNDDQITGGAGLALPLSNHTLELNYGYSNDRILHADIHRVSVVFSFGSKAKPAYESSGSAYPSKKKRNPGRTGYRGKGEFVVVTARVLNVRSGPGTRYLKIAQAKSGQRLEMLQQKGVWRKIRLDNGRTGWVHGKYVRLIN